MKIEKIPTVELEVTIRLTEAEARALDALVGYGADAFLKVFYKELGESYMKPHEFGLRSLFEAAREYIPVILRHTNDARAVFNGQKVAVSPTVLKKVEAESAGHSGGGK